MKRSTLLKMKMATWPTLSIFFPRQVACWAKNLFLTPERIARPTSEHDYFVTSKKHKFKNGIAGFEWGQPTHPLVILLHGWSGRGTQLGAFAAPLVNKGFRVVAVDGPAHGDSEGTHTHVGQFAQFLIDLQMQLGPYKGIIAHSFGAGCSILSAARGLKVEKIVIVAGPSRYEKVVDYFLSTLKLSSRCRQIFKDDLKKLVNLPISDMNVGIIGKTLSIPTLILHDKDDKEVPVAAAEEIKNHWPQAQLIITSGLGHRRILKDPTVTETAAKFISS
ncbi:MAG: alpha/beta hydrolase [Bdellovibrionaceae bacterium]|nr:alpha/beta hydrolase [Pseudobdellovibrionaceae bacterium]